MIGLQLRRLWAPARLRRPRKGLRAYQLGLALAFLFLLHGLLVNALLLSGGLRWLLDRTTSVVEVDTGWSFSIWPGVVQLRGVHLHVTDSHAHLQLEVPKGRANISLRELLRQRFATASVTGEHFVLRVRPKIEGLSERRTAALPPLPEPVSKPSGEPSEQPRLWSIRLQGLAAQFDELWVGELRYRGDARITGGFELVPQERVRVDSSEVALRGGALIYGAEQRTFDVRELRLQAELRQTQVEELRQNWNQNVSIRIDLSGRVVELGFAASLLPELEGLSDGQGELTFRAVAEHGQWLGDVDLEYAAPRIAYARDAWNGSLALSLATQATEREAAPATGNAAPLRVTASVQAGALDLQGQRLVRLESCQLDLQLSRAFLFSVPRSFRLALRGLALAELERLPPPLRPGQWRPRSANIARARASLDWGEGAASGSAETEFRDLSFGYGDWSFRQSGKLSVQDVRWRGPGYKLTSSGLMLGLDPVSMRGPETQIDAWKLRLELEQIAYAPVAQRLTAGVVFAGQDARPVLSLLGVRSLPPGAADFLAMPDLRVRGRLDLSPERQDIAIERAESKTIDVHGRWIREGQQSHAALLFQAAPLSLGVDVQPGATSVRPFANEAWLRSHLARMTNAVPEGH